MGVKLGDRASRSWAAAAVALQEGEPVAEACARAGLDAARTARLTAPAGGAWVDLLDKIKDARVLVVEHAPGPASLRIAAQAALVGLAEADAARADFRRAWLSGLPARLLIDAEPRLAAGEHRWDLVIVDGVGACGTGRELTLEAHLRELVAGLAPGGRLVAVADNCLSPLRATDRAAGRPVGPPGPSLHAVERAIQRTGLAVVQRFGLLRSSVDGATAFDIDAPRATAAILSAATVRTGPFRTCGLHVLTTLANKGRASWFVPAWMVVASRAATAWKDDRRPTGRLGYKDSRESKVLRGEPPVELEKRYSTPDAAKREAMALRALEAGGFRRVPRLLAAGPGWTRQTWTSGRPLRPDSLRRSEVAVWVGRAAQVLGEIQRATAQEDGSVLVHGDYWLGNLLVEAAVVVGVIDWSDAHWGQPTEDLRHLVKTLLDTGLASSRDAASLAELASRVCAEARRA